MVLRLNTLSVTVHLENPAGPVNCMLYVNGVQAGAPVRLENDTPAELEAAGDWALGHHSFTVLRLSADEPEQTAGSWVAVESARINGMAIPMVPFTQQTDGHSPPIGFAINEHGFSVAEEIGGLHRKLDEALELLRQPWGIKVATELPAPSPAPVSREAVEPGATPTAAPELPADGAPTPPAAAPEDDATTKEAA